MQRQELLKANFTDHPNCHVESKAKVTSCKRPDLDDQCRLTCEQAQTGNFGPPSIFITATARLDCLKRAWFLSFWHLGGILIVNPI